MKSLLLIIFSLLLSSTFVYSSNLSNKAAESFIQLLISNSDSLSMYFDSIESSRSKRLGILYNEIKFKELIANDIDPKIKQQILKNKITYEYEIDSLSEEFSKLTIKISKLDLTYSYFFKNSKLISKPAYYSQNWDKLESNYFIFHVSNKSNINSSSIKCLDKFVDKILILLKADKNEINNLKKDKIHYFLCQNESEIKDFTGYAARGIYNLAYDYIISTYNCHYHEICHLLINYKLKKLDLYTLPLLQEGFAVAYGGRGGKEPDVILEMGKFLYKSNFMNYDMLLNKNDFAQFDASMSYPAAGVFIKFIIDTYGIDKFLTLYKKYSSNLDKINDLKIDLKTFPSKAEWEKYLNSFNKKVITISNIDEKTYPNNVINKTEIKINENETKYLIKIRNSVGLIAEHDNAKYRSSLFSELFPDQRYNGENYIITANDNEISIYNLFTNNLVAKYAQGFSVPGKYVEKKGGYFTFAISKSILDEPIKNYRVVKIN